MSRRVASDKRPFDAIELNEITVEDVRLHNIRRDIALLCRALELLGDRLTEHREVSMVLSDPGASSRESHKALERMMPLGLDIELHVRTAYGLLYEIKELIRRMRGGPSVPAAVFDELERLCIYRRFLVVHKHDGERILGGRLWGLNDGFDVTIGVGLGSIPEADGCQLEAIFKRARSGLPVEGRDEANWNERLQLLYEHWPAVASTDRRDAKALIARNGIRSDPPIVLVRAAQSLVDVYFPKIPRSGGEQSISHELSGL